MRSKKITKNDRCFILQSYEHELSEAFDLNTAFFRIEASDADTGSNAVIYYHIIGDCKCTTRSAIYPTQLSLMSLCVCCSY